MNKVVKIKTLVVALAGVGLATLPSYVLANPTGGQVVAGSAVIRQESATKVGINQTTDKAIIDWQKYSIGANEQVQYYQPSASSVTLNRVVGQDPSQILGRLTANGQVFLVNPNGIYFGKNAQIDVAGLVASTHNIRNEDFMAGKHLFNIPGKPGASVINEGSIRVADTGIAAFVAPSVANRGIIAAKLGRVVMAAANGFTLDFTGDNLLSFMVNDNVAQTAFDLEGKPLTSFVENSGKIEAQGGYVLLTAKAAENAIHGVINHSGVIEAQTVNQKNGEIILHAGKGSLEVSGTLDASAANGGDGGFLETSGGKVNIADSAKITTAAPFGKTGTWLIDPNDYTIAASGGNITGAVLAGQLANTNIYIQTSTMGTSGGNGDIFVNDFVAWTANKLRLSAGRNIYLNRTLNGSGTASLALEYGQLAVASGNTADYYVNAPVNLPTGQNFSTKLGSDGLTNNYTVITSLGAAGDTTTTTLQGMKNNSSGLYALGADIDAKTTSGWHSGLGFAPIVFSGRFHGLGHSVDGLVANRPNEYNVGALFASLSTGSTVRDIGVTNVKVTGSRYVGGLVGYNEGRVATSYSTGEIKGVNWVAGGLIGEHVYGATLTNSYSSATVDGEIWAGGLVGGFINATIQNSYAVGKVTGRDRVGGLEAEGLGTTSNSYWNTQSSGQTRSDSGTGKTTAEMKQQATYSGWDFTNVWTIQEGQGYPVLRWTVGSGGKSSPSEKIETDPCKISPTSCTGERPKEKYQPGNPFHESGLVSSESIYSEVNVFDRYKKGSLKENDILDAVTFSRAGMQFTLESFHNSNNDSYSYSGENQCTNLVSRYLNGLYGLTTSDKPWEKMSKEERENYSSAKKKGKAFGIPNGGKVAADLAENFGDMFSLFNNGDATSPPAIGAVLSMKYGKTGHVAIVKAVKLDGDKAYVQLIEQNVGSGEGPIKNRVAIFSKDENGHWSGKGKTKLGGGDAAYEDVIAWANPK